ncbi:MAG: hypothetical protein OER96_07140 [Gammaproteobacteria bacterium]|nr:hypothetical protein [Gammaproteobacteria bacterium]
MKIANYYPCIYRKLSIALGLGVSLFAVSSHYSAAQDVISTTTNVQTAAEIATYWTPERMQNAEPVPLPEVVQPSSSSSVSSSALPAGAKPSYAPGWAPGSGPQPSADLRIEIDKGHALYDVATGLVDTQDGAVPTNPADPLAYAPFQRWTWFGRYLTYPTSTIGKLFFTLNGGNFVCSASVIQKNTLATAGHCVSDGAGNFATNFLFCPSYNKGGPSGSGAPNPATGCWAFTSATVPSAWFFSAEIDRDYACIVTATTGDTVADSVGNVTGWTGRAANWAPRQATIAWGYPQGAPFLGYHIITTASSEWYSVDMSPSDGTVDQVSKYIGSDQTGGSSGGPWWMNMAHKSAEYADSDSSGFTDPGQNAVPPGPIINGVNSHKRCLVNCNTPPSNTAGLFWQEMGSPPFLFTSGDPAESEDIFTICFDSGGS